MQANLRKSMRFETMENRELFAADLGVDLAMASDATDPGTAEIDFVEVAGDSSEADYDSRDSFIADSFSFGVEREMKESGEKAGTEDINIGVGELDQAFANDFQTSDDDQAKKDDGRATYYKYELTNVMVTSYDVNGR